MSFPVHEPDPSQGAGPTDTVPWHRYVRTLCSRAWDLDDATTESLVARFDDLARARRVTDGLIVSVLLESGVSETSALMIAPSIRVSILS